MIKHQGVYLPDNEQHLIDWMNKAGEVVDGKGTYQIKKLRAALGYVKSFRTAVDIGAHCGLWSLQLVKQFKHLEAFEPVKEHRNCYEANLSEYASKYNLWGCALGEKEGFIRIETQSDSTGNSRVAGTGDIPMYTLDSFELDEVDFIKIDTEGFEYFAVKGAEETVKRCRPIMIVEQKGHGTQYHGIRKEAAVELLQSWGMRAMQPPLSGDWIMGW